MGDVVEYDQKFKEIWRYTIKSPWAALRLKNGNTLISDEADTRTEWTGLATDAGLWHLEEEEMRARVPSRCPAGAPAIRHRG